MKKLALDPDALRVESFATRDAGDARGTVRGHDDTMETEWCTIEDGCSRLCKSRHGEQTCAPYC